MRVTAPRGRGSIGAVSPKTLTGEELELDDAPARDSDLFLVDGNNLAYRAFFALPEELATSDGVPTNALLGFTNMLFKLLSDYRPKARRGRVGLAAGAPRRRSPRRRDVVYKEGRRPMPDLLREQFPHFRPIVEAFGYRNLEFEGWEADDVIATLATRADARRAPHLRRLDRPRRVPALLGERLPDDDAARGRRRAGLHARARRGALRHPARPDPRLHRAQGRHVRQHPRHPRDRRQDRRPADRAVRLARGGDRARGRALARARARNITEHADQARVSKELATMRRDLDIDFDPAAARARAARPLAAEGDLPPLRVPRPARPASTRSTRRCRPPPVEVTGVEVPWREGELDRLRPRRLRRGGRPRPPSRPPTESSSARARAGSKASSSCTTRSRCGVDAADDTLLAAYLIEPGRAEYELSDLGAEYGVELVADARRPTRRPPRSSSRAELPRRLVAAAARPARGAQPDRALPRDRAAADAACSPTWSAPGVKIDTYRMGEITARLAERVAELESMAYELAGEEFMLGSTQQVARVLFEQLGLTAGRKGKTGYSTDAKVLRSIRDEHAIVPVIEEWRELSKLLNTYLGPLPTLIDESTGRLHTTINQTVASTGRLSTTSPNLQSIPIRTDLGREIRSAFIAEDGAKLLSADYSQIELRILAHVSGEPKLREAFARGEDIHRATAAEVLGKDPATLTTGERSIAKMINFGIVYGISAFGLSENLEIPREQAQAYIDAYLARFPHVQDFIARTIEQATRDGYVDDAARPPPPGARDPGRRTARPAPARRADRRQLLDAGLERRHHQGGDDPHPRPPARRGPRRQARAPGARRAAARGARRRGEGRSASSSAPRCAAPTTSIRRSRSTSASARTGPRPRAEPSPRCRPDASACRTGCSHGRAILPGRFGEQAISCSKNPAFGSRAPTGS